VSTKTTLAHGNQWYLQEDWDGTITLEIMGVSGLSVSTNQEGTTVALDIPLELARRISGEPEVKLVPVAGSDLMPHWIRLIGMLHAAGRTSEPKASDIASLFPNGRTPRSIQAAASALARRGILGRILVCGGTASHYWLTEEGLSLIEGRTL
jgi:hypothetical protein